VNAHDDMLDSIALLALGALPENEARLVAEHARDCVECRAEFAGLRSAADTLGYAAEVPLGELDDVSAARMKATVIRSVRASRNGALTGPDFVFPAREPARARSPWLVYLAAAAAIVFGLVTSARDVGLRSQNETAQQQIAELHQELGTQAEAARRGELLEERLADLTAPASKHFPVAMGEVVTSGGHVFLALKMGDLAPGKVYQAWTLRRGTTSMAPSVTFVAESGITLVELPESAGGLAAVAVSVEPVGGSKTPTSKPTFVRSLG